MLRKLLRRTVLVASAFVMLFVVAGFSNANAANGNWTSAYYTDMNGVSQVGTTRNQEGAVNVT